MAEGTMRVRHAGFPGHEILINAEDFDPAVHERVDAPEEFVAKPPKTRGKKE